MPPRDWNIKAVRAPEALKSLERGNIWGDLKVAHIDMGVTGHPALGTWIKINAGQNYVEPDKLPIDPLQSDKDVLGHGTKTCSVLCGRDDENGFVGAAPRLPAIPYRVTNHVVIHDKVQRQNIAKAIQHAIDEHDCRVVTISLGFPTAIAGNAELGGAIDYAYDHGVIVVAAGGQKISVPCYPGKFYRTISAGGYVAAPNGTPARMYQNYEKLNGWMDIWAPAKPIFRALGWKPETPEDKLYQLDGHGTSNATPLVAAAAAMWLVKHGDALDKKYGARTWQRVEAFRACLKLSAQNLSHLTDFAAIKPPARFEEIVPKGAAANPTTGGLDIVSLLAQELPDSKKLTQSGPAKGQKV